MFKPDHILLYVKNPVASADFYANLLGMKPVELHPTFALFVLSTGIKLGLWIREGVLPAVAGIGTGGELAYSVETRDQVDAMYRDWSSRGITIAQKPEQMDFGYTFTALDPDGHRLRLYFPSEE